LKNWWEITVLSLRYALYIEDVPSTCLVTGEYLDDIDSTLPGPVYQAARNVFGLYFELSFHSTAIQGRSLISAIRIAVAGIETLNTLANCSTEFTDKP
jgi:hypothetical protein